MKHTACQHTAKDEPACEDCTYFGIIPKITPSNHKNFSGFLNNISHIKIALLTNPAFVAEFMIGMGYVKEELIENAA